MTSVVRSGATLQSADSVIQQQKKRCAVASTTLHSPDGLTSNFFQRL
jgi:hypothetical protein